MSTTDFNPENLERRLADRPFRSLPTDWRDGILSAARAGARARATQPALQSHAWSRAALWPSPAAWAGVAAAWVAILVLNHASHWEPAPSRVGTPGPPAELGVVLIEHRRQLNELLNVAPEETGPVPAPLPAPAQPAPRGALPGTNRLA